MVEVGGIIFKILTQLHYQITHFSLFRWRGVFLARQTLFRDFGYHSLRVVHCSMPSSLTRPHRQVPSHSNTTHFVTYADGDEWTMTSGDDDSSARCRSWSFSRHRRMLPTRSAHLRPVYQRWGRCYTEETVSNTLDDDMGKH